jgi:hypothetical protein
MDLRTLLLAALTTDATKQTVRRRVLRTIKRAHQTRPFCGKRHRARLARQIRDGHKTEANGVVLTNASQR